MHTHTRLERRNDVIRGAAACPPCDADPGQAEVVSPTHLGHCAKCKAPLCTNASREIGVCTHCSFVCPQCGRRSPEAGSTGVCMMCEISAMQSTVAVWSRMIPVVRRRIEQRRKRWELMIEGSRQAAGLAAQPRRCARVVKHD